MLVEDVDVLVEVAVGVVVWVIVVTATGVVEDVDVLGWAVVEIVVLSSGIGDARTAALAKASRRTKHCILVFPAG